MIRLLPCTLALLAITASASAAQVAPTALPPPPPDLGQAPRPDGQAPRPDAQTPPPGAPKTTIRTPPAAEVPLPTPPGPPRRRGREVNVQVELTITDHVGGGKPETRVVSMVVADGAFGRIRSVSENNVEKLNVDASPELLEGDRMWISLTVEYVPPRAESAVRRPAMLNEQMSVILQSGKPLLISQAADPLADRRTTVEVRATIIK